MFDFSKKLIGVSLVLTLIAVIGFSAAEPQAAGAVTDSVVITLNVTQGITISTPSDSTMSTSLSLSQNTAVGTTTWNVKTNDPQGYAMEVRASTNPAMQFTSTSTIADYQTGAPNTWSVSSGAANFGYSAFGSDTATATWGTDTDCYGATNHSVSTALKYKGFTTSAGSPNIANRTATTTSAGTDTDVCYAVEQNNFFIPAGTYTATITATATGN